MINYPIVLILFIIFSSCKTIVSSLMGVNNNKTFDNKIAYQTFVYKKYGI